ncbi:MAG: GMC family oxidoreductase N-terminal domain-containing protein, partial [Gammaproteobacteria bacterium]|nr:GMC family oxidoreductase N-terminal domain-containing protein [Gammaproteobacteria bacterium]
MAVAFDKKDDHVVVVIGSGAGGGTLCHELTATGIDVVCIEAGAPLNDIVPDSAAMFPRLTWLDRRIGSGDMPPDFPVWSGKNVGGTTLHWTATALRFPDEQFAATRYLGGLEDCSVIDWPVTADEMRPWYARAEQSMGVSGTNDWPHLPDSNNYRVLKEGARRIGLTGEKSTMAINSVARDGRPACQQIGFCVSGCPTNAKWTAANTPIAKALETSHFELRDRSFVLRVEHDDADWVNSVVYVDENGDIQRQSARVVCMAANSIDTARILLNSESS